jgi:hypothetical protein
LSEYEAQLFFHFAEKSLAGVGLLVIAEGQFYTLAPQRL